MAIGALRVSCPKQLGSFAVRFGTPIVVNVSSGIISTILHGHHLLRPPVAPCGYVRRSARPWSSRPPPSRTSSSSGPDHPRRNTRTCTAYVVPGGNTGRVGCGILTMFWDLGRHDTSPCSPGLLPRRGAPTTKLRVTHDVRAYTAITIVVLSVIAGSSSGCRAWA